MAYQIDELSQFIINIALRAGAISIAFTTFVLKNNIGEGLRRFIFLVGSLSGFMFIVAALITWIDIIVSVPFINEINYIFLFCGIINILYYVVYIFFKMIKIKISSEWSS